MQITADKSFIQKITNIIRLELPKERVNQLVEKWREWLLKYLNCLHKFHTFTPDCTYFPCVYTGNRSSHMSKMQRSRFLKPHKYNNTSIHHDTLEVCWLELDCIYTSIQTQGQTGAFSKTESPQRKLLPLASLPKTLLSLRRCGPQIPTFLQGGQLKRAKEGKQTHK